MLPFVFAAPLIGAGGIDLTIYIGGAVLASASGLAGYFLGSQKPKPEPKPSSTQSSSSWEKENYRRATELKETHSQKMKPALENIGKDAVKQIEQVLVDMRKRQQQWHSLLSTFDNQTSGMKATKEALQQSIDKLEQTNQIAAETAAQLTQEINKIQKKSSSGAHDISNAMTTVTTQSARLHTLILDFERIKQELDCTQLQYRAQVVVLSESLTKAGHQLRVREKQMSAQDEQINMLQSSLNELTELFEKTLQKSEAQAQFIATLKSENQQKMASLHTLKQMEIECEQEPMQYTV